MLSGSPTGAIIQGAAARRQRFDSPQQEAYLNLWRTYDRLRIEEDRLFERFGLTAQQYNALRLLRGAYPGRIATLDLAERLVSRAPDITRLLDKLEQQELIRRERPAGNRRVVEVQITDRGLKRLKAIDGPVRRCHARQLGHFSQNQLRQLIRLLREARKPHEPPGSAWT